MQIRRKKTTSQREQDVKRNWILIDGRDRVLGQLATEIVDRLTGKHKATYTPHIDGGDYVVVINASNVVVTGNKPEKKAYIRHSNYPGGLRRESFASLQARDPEAVIRLAVKGMLPDNKLRAARLDRLKVFADGEHTYHNFIKD